MWSNETSFSEEIEEEESYEQEFLKALLFWITYVYWYVSFYYLSLQIPRIPLLEIDGDEESYEEGSGKHCKSIFTMLALFVAVSKAVLPLNRYLLVCLI